MAILLYCNYYKLVIYCEEPVWLLQHGGVGAVVRDANNKTDTLFAMQADLRSLLDLQVIG